MGSSESTPIPEVAGGGATSATAIRQGRGRQEPLNPRKYRDAQPCDDLPAGFNHVVGTVLFGFDVNA